MNQITCYREFLTCTTIACSGAWPVGHLPVGFKTSWACDECHHYFKIERLDGATISIVPDGRMETPITVTLESQTTPAIRLKLHAWKYGYSQNHTPEEFSGHERYYYDHHTCPTNFMNEVARIEFEGDSDPHGVFSFVTVEDGHIANEDREP